MKTVLFMWEEIDNLVIKGVLILSTAISMKRLF